MRNPEVYRKTLRSATLVQNQSGNMLIKITFPFSHEELARIKTLPERKYEPTEKYWITPLIIDTIRKLRDWNYLLDPKLEGYLANGRVVQTVKGIEVPGLRGLLYEFQKEGVAFIEMRKGRALVADEMGLGKTIQTLAWLQLHPELRPVIIVTPATVKLNWARETLRWLPNPNVQLLGGTIPFGITGDIAIINYDVLKPWIQAIRIIAPKVLITDECQFYKNNSAERTTAVKMLAKGIPHVIALSGTPIVNRPVEMFNALRLIDPALFSNYRRYTERYCDAHQGFWGWDVSGASNQGELHELLTSTVMIRRLKSDENIGLELPDKVHSYIPIELDNLREYDSAERDFIAYVRRTKGNEDARRAERAKTLAQIEGLKQLAVRGKLKRIIEWIEDFLETDNKLVVYAYHAFTIDALMQKFGKVGLKIDGSVPPERRLALIDRFQTETAVRLFIISDAGGIGINLTAASNIAVSELPGLMRHTDLDQAIDRLHRIGQKYTVNAHYLLASDTIEERIARLLDNKRKTFNRVLNGEDIEAGSLLSELMKQYE